MSTVELDTIATGIGRLQVNRPEKLNALNEEALQEMRRLLQDAHADSGLTGLILTGAGKKAFIAGADIAAMEKMDSAAAADFSRLGQEVSLLLEESPFPVIACVHGPALGGGCEMAMSCDFIYASQDALFGQPEVKLGLIPGFGGTCRLARRVGRSRAAEIIYSARHVSAKEALELGLVNRVFDDRKSLLEEACESLRRMRQHSPAAIAAAKRTLNSADGVSVREGLSRELAEFAAVFGTPQMGEGVRAFLEKRPADFGGRRVD